MSTSPFEITWKAPEFEERPKNISWYWVSMCIAIGLLMAAMWQKNFLFGFFIVIAEILILIWANQKPKMIAFTLNEKGLAIGERLFYAYNELASFSARKEDPDSTWSSLQLNFTKPLRPNSKIYVPKDRLEEISKALRLSIKEVDSGPSFFDTLQDLSGF